MVYVPLKPTNLAIVEETKPEMSDHGPVAGMLWMVRSLCLHVVELHIKDPTGDFSGRSEIKMNAIVIFFWIYIT